MKINKTIFQFLLFFLLMFLTFYVIFSKNDLHSIALAIKEFNLFYLVLGVAASCFFVCGEGFMIWYLLTGLKSGARLIHCICYSFIGFFFSGITPSATGGQPMQLIYMKKDGISFSNSTLVLMIVAVLYKFVLTLIGAFLLLFGKERLELFLGSYMSLFYLGMFLNIFLVILLLLVMFHGEWMQKIIEKAEGFLVAVHLLKPSAHRKESISHLITGYKEALSFFLCHKGKILFVTVCTFLQRCSVFFLTYFIYRGFHLEKSSLMLVISLQAAVYIAVDMLPLPGAQGISELIYHAVFSGIFTGGYLTASMCLTRGISFYLPLLFGALVTVCRLLIPKKINKCHYKPRTE